MLKTWEFGVLTGLGVLALVLVITNAVLIDQNRAEQKEIGSRQAFVQQTGQIEGLYQQLLRSIAGIATNTNDADLGAVLTRQGITFSAQPKPTESAPKGGK